MTTLKPPDEEVEKLALEIYNKYRSFRSHSKTSDDGWDEVARFVLAREQAAVAKAIKSCSDALDKHYLIPSHPMAMTDHANSRNTAVVDCQRTILAKL